MQPRLPRTGSRRTPTLRSPAERGGSQPSNSDVPLSGRGRSSLCADEAAISYLAGLSCPKLKWAAGLAPRNTPT